MAGAHMRSAGLAGAIPSRTDFTSANLTGADFDGAHFRRTILSDANLEDADNLPRKQLGAAFGNAGTKLPDGLTVRPCRWTLHNQTG